MPVEFVIPVTDGCRRITQYKPYGKQADFIVSAIFAKGEVSSLVQSKDFHEMIGKRGALFENDLSSGEGYKLFIDRRIGSGESWRLPTALNHVFNASRYAELAQKAEEQLVVWSTGSIDQTLVIDADIAYEIELKLEQSKDLILSFLEAGKQVVILIPAHEQGALKTEIVNEIEKAGAAFHLITGVFDALEIIAEALGDPLEGVQVTKNPTPKPTGKGKAVVPILAIFALLAGGGVLYTTIDSSNIEPSEASFTLPPQPSDDGDLDDGAVQEEPKPESVPAPLPGFQMNALEGSEVTSCIALVAQSGVAITRPLGKDESDTYTVEIGPNLCGLQLKNTSADIELAISVSPELRAHFIANALPKQGVTLAPQETISLHFSRTKPSGQHTITVSGAAKHDIKIEFSGAN